MKKLRPDETRYSDEITGDKRNHEWSVRFDVNGDGYLGISQKKEEKDGGPYERVLLSPKQVAALKKFLGTE